MSKITGLFVLTAGIFLAVACGNKEQPETDVFPEAVDLGLSVKWASFNVGAHSPYEAGFYLAWGETSPKEYYTHLTYSMGTGDWGKVSKYQSDEAQVLAKEDDVAHAAYGGSWRMPTLEEINELRTATFLLRKVVKENGVWGLRITSAKTRNSIFLPACGTKYMSSTVQGENEFGCYWSSTTQKGNPFQAQQLWITPSLTRQQEIIYIQAQTRFTGASVRAVK